MAIKFTAMSPADYTDIGREVKETYSNDPYANMGEGLTSSLIFGDKAKNFVTNKSTARDNIRGYISLARPIVNKVLARGDASLLAKVLGYSAETFRNICNFMTVWSKSEERLIPAKDAKSIDDILCYGEIFELMIDKFDIEEAIKLSFKGIIRSVLTDKVCEKYAMSYEGEILKRSEGIPLAGGWAFFPKDMKVYAMYDAMQEAVKTYFNNEETRLTFLLNMSNTNNLKGAVTRYVTVLPLGMRPDVDGRHDPISVNYADLIAANNRLKLVTSGEFNCAEYIARYKAMARAADFLISTINPYRQKRKPIIEILKGKKGFIRGSMLGKRVDYSGRSVITIDPTLSVNEIAIPRKLAPKLYRHHLLKTYNKPILKDILGAENNEKMCERLEEKGILEKVPTIIGRQPTLHRLNMQAYNTKLTNTHSIQVNPLTVPAFNADFDGDQMWMRVPISQDAVQETKDLLMTTQNLFLAENGECTIKPRQEIVYGLNICTLDYPKSASIASYDTFESVANAVLNQEVAVSDTVTAQGITDTAGKLAFRWCLGYRDPEEICEITTKSLGKYINTLLEKGNKTYIAAMDRMVKLGFGVGYIYPPTLKLLGYKDVVDFTGFHESVQTATDWYNLGYEEESNFNLVYDTAYSNFDDKVKNNIIKTIGEDNGFSRLASSGARGSKGNLTQIFGYKGRVQKNKRESFKSVIEHSYVEQLTPLEHMVTAYGGRKGLIDKSLNTADTGYASRQMWHSGQSMVITSNDCGTHEGLTISKSDIAMFTDDEAIIRNSFANIIRGRYLAETGQYISKDLANQIASTQDSVVIRSPLTCKKPCCRKCYGDDLSTNRNAAVGLPIGIIAAHSVGKIASQLSLDSFKKGGVATGGDVVSSFDKVEAYLNMRGFKDNDKFAGYDPIAWASGPIKSTPENNNRKRIRIEGSLKSISVPANALIKEVAEKGKGICVERGDYSPKELLEYAGVEETQKYLIHMLYSIHRDETEVNMKHFETLVASMTMAMVIDTDRKDLKVGQYHDMVQLMSGSLENTTYYKTIVGIKKVQTLRPMAMSGIIMEYIVDGLSRSVLLETEDPLMYPIQRAVLGMSTTSGNAYLDFTPNRKV